VSVKLAMAFTVCALRWCQISGMADVTRAYRANLVSSLVLPFGNYVLGSPRCVRFSGSGEVNLERPALGFGWFTCFENLALGGEPFFVDEVLGIPKFVSTRRYSVLGRPISRNDVVPPLSDQGDLEPLLFIAAARRP